MNAEMNRWVEVNGKTVSFGNVVGMFCGRPYCYECATAEDAATFGTYLEQRDSANVAMPTAVTDEIKGKFHATEIK